MARDSGTEATRPTEATGLSGPKPTLKSRPGAAGLTNAIGGMLVGLDEQLLRSQPRAEILVKRGSQLRIERDAGGDLIVDLPEPIEPPRMTRPED